MNVDAGIIAAPLRALPTPRQLQKLTILVFSLFCLSYALFTQDIVSHNTLCRAALSANLVQHGHVDINGFEDFTKDKASREGNFYCDKAPGMSFLAAPMAAVFTQFFAITPETPYGRVWLAYLYLSALTTSGLLSALAAVFLFRFVLLRTEDLSAAFVSSIAFGLGTPVWGWATSFFSHSAAAALLLIGFISIDEARRHLTTDGRPTGFAMLGGLTLGASIAVEYTTAVPALVIAATALIASDWSRPSVVLAALTVAAISALAALAPVFVYHAAAFGSPFTTGYKFAAFYEGTRGGLFGINLPSAEALGELLVSADRGVVWYAPIFVVAAWAMLLLLRRKELRMTAIAMILIIAYYFLMNAGFVYWKGGASTGPRYLTPAIGLAMLALGLGWPQFGPWLRRGALAVLGVSILINFAATAVDMTAGTFADSVLPSFLSADLRHTLTYRLYKQPHILHFAAPVLLGWVMGWLIVKQVRSIQSTAMAR